MEWYLKTWANEGKIPLYTRSDKRLDGINPELCRAVRPDFLFDQGTWVLVIEIDEDSHKIYEPRCEHTRIMEITNAFGQLPVYVLRYNPHACRVNNTTRRITITERTDLLLKTLQYAFANPSFDHHIMVQYLWYSCTRCPSAGQCSFQHIEKFETILEYAAFIDATYKLNDMGSGQKPGPSAMALH